MTVHKKLIEVALPLEAINKASTTEKSIRHGHPSTLHLWWARRPLATCRAVLFASLVDDPSSHPEDFPTEEAQDKERQRLFRLIEAMVKWENSNNEQVMAAVRAEIRKATGDNPPPVFDPFCGGGSIPLEAQRLGLEAHGSDLNPVAVLITKALVEIPPKFAGHAPVNPEAKPSLMVRDWHSTQGLAEDIRYYGKWMRDEAAQRIGHLYPKVTLPKEYGGGQATVIAWLWAHTVTCPNPACGARMPLVRSFWLSKKKGKEAWVEPEVDRTVSPPAIRFTMKTGMGKPREGTVNRQGAMCIACNTSVTVDHIRTEGKSGRIDAQLMAIVAEGQRGRIYLPPIPEQEKISRQAELGWGPRQEMPKNPRWFSPPLYGMSTFADLFTPRQLVALTTFSDLVSELRERVQAHAFAAGLLDDGVPLNDGGMGATAYADAIATYLAFVLNKLADIANQLCAWEPIAQCPRHLFGRQAIPMIWDFAEGNPLGTSSGSWLVLIDNLMRSLQSPLMAHERPRFGIAKQFDATAVFSGVSHPLISTDPPYYDNISYADLSDFFYVWLRRSLNAVYPDLFSTLLVPKAQELIATPYRFGGDKAKAQHFFETGLGQAFARMRAIQHSDYPLTVYYAFKQSESDADEEMDEGGKNGKNTVAVASTGWETMLEGLIQSGFTVTGTWPMRTEMGSRMVGQGTNVLASSIVLVCRPRPEDAPLSSRRDFLNALRRELPQALKNLQRGNIAPVDLAQASIGPGMAVFSRYRRVLESDGSPMRIRTALQLINRTLDEVLAEQEGEYDAETRWAVAWFEQYEMNEGPYGVAETLSKAKNASVQTLVHAGLLEAKSGKVRLLRRDELPVEWNPATAHLTVWEVMQRLIRALDKEDEVRAATMLRKVGGLGEVARDLAYRLYTVCERKGWTQEALAYNSLVVAWSEVGRLASRERETGEVVQGRLLG